MPKTRVHNPPLVPKPWYSAMSWDAPVLSGKEADFLLQGSANVFREASDGAYFTFAGHPVFVVPVQLCPCRTKAAPDYI